MFEYRTLTCRESQSLIRRRLDGCWTLISNAVSTRVLPMYPRFPDRDVRLGSLRLAPHLTSNWPGTFPRREKGLYCALLRCTRPSGRAWGSSCRSPPRRSPALHSSRHMALQVMMQSACGRPRQTRTQTQARTQTHTCCAFSIPTLFSLPLPPSPIATHSTPLFLSVPGRQQPAPAPTPAPPSAPTSATPAAKKLLVVSFPKLSGPLLLPSARHATPSMPSLPPVPRVLPPVPRVLPHTPLPGFGPQTTHLPYAS